jgi:hypothetical protein
MSGSAKVFEAHMARGGPLIAATIFHLIGRCRSVSAPLLNLSEEIFVVRQHDELEAAPAQFLDRLDGLAAPVAVVTGERVVKDNTFWPSAPS